MDEPWRFRVVNYTVATESAGDSYAAVNPGQGQDGLAFGLIQWNQSSGDLGHLLLAMSEASPQTFLSTFGPSAHALLTTTNADSREGRLAPVGGVPLTQEPWVSRFRKAGDVPAFRQVQDDFAANGFHMQKAIEAAQTLEATTERGLALAFDIATFYGPYGATKLARSVLAATPTATYPARLRAYALADAARFLSMKAPASEDAKRWTRVGNAWHRLIGGRDWYNVALDRHMRIVNATDLSDSRVDTGAAV